MWLIVQPLSNYPVGSFAEARHIDGTRRQVIQPCSPEIRKPAQELEMEDAAFATCASIVPLPVEASLADV